MTNDKKGITMSTPTLTAEQRWVVDYAREHCYPFGVDLGTLVSAFGEFFAAHDPDHYDEDKFYAACEAASEEACDRWERNRR